MSRIKREEYYMGIAELVSKRSTCLRRQVGAVLVKDDAIISTGYNGAPKGLLHCEVTGCLREKMGVPSGERHELCRGVHAEQNCIVQAAVHGVSVEGAILYTTTFPCSVCAKMIINAGVKNIYYKGNYNDEMSKHMLKDAGVYTEEVI